LAKLRHPTQDFIVDALIRAGELETALADAGCDEADVAARITDAIATALVSFPSTHLAVERIASVVERMRISDRLELSIPEGFAYYALHPLAYAELVDDMRLQSRQAAVIGIRSIGSTLSAVVVAALVTQGIRAKRITVRPVGHPYDRKTHFTEAQLRWISAQRDRDAEFLIVDEGPGLSGSSFLSVGESLLEAGVEHKRICFLGSRQVDPGTLNSPQGAERWRGFRSEFVKAHGPAGEGLIDVGAGKWRKVLPTHRAQEHYQRTTRSGAMCGAPQAHPPKTSRGGAPGSWIHMERSKFLSADGCRLFKFVGLGRFGEEVGRRAQILAATGFGPRCFGIRDGYAEYERLSGHWARRKDLSRTLLERIADYCAMRAVEFRVNSASHSPLEAMTRYNYEQEFGEAVPKRLQILEPSKSVLCDSRMMPHEWIIATDGIARKCDGETHSDDHFFPGPTDVAWDLAGAIVEWEMETEAQEALLRCFAARNGDDARSRIETHVLAYATFRLAFCRMAASALAGHREQRRLAEDANRYHRWMVGRFGAPSHEVSKGTHDASEVSATAVPPLR
jgi:hypothetical protein